MVQERQRLCGRYGPRNQDPEKFDATAAYVTQWGGSGSGSGQFDYPQKASLLDGNNNVYVTDTENYRVDKFNGNGGLIGGWGSDGDGIGQFQHPAGIAVDSGNSDVYVVDRGNARVEKFDENGNFLGAMGQSRKRRRPVPDLPKASRWTRATTFMWPIQATTAWRSSTAAGYLTQWGGSGTGNGQFTNYGVEDGPEGIALDSTGNFIYVADGGNNAH